MDEAYKCARSSRTRRLLHAKLQYVCEAMMASWSTRSICQDHLLQLLQFASALAPTDSSTSSRELLLLPLPCALRSPLASSSADIDLVIEPAAAADVASDNGLSSFPPRLASSSGTQVDLERSQTAASTCKQLEADTSEAQAPVGRAEWRAC